MGPKPTPVQDRFWPKVDKRGPDECWPWLASVTSNGYGKILVNGRLEPAPRVSFVLAHGEIPAGLWVLHRCDNPPCVNPAHLFVGTRSDNVRDMYAKGRDRSPMPLGLHGEKHPMAKHSDATVLAIREATLAGERLPVIARRLGIPYGTVWGIARGVKRISGPAKENP